MIFELQLHCWLYEDTWYSQENNFSQLEHPPLKPQTSRRHCSK